MRGREKRCRRTSRRQRVSCGRNADGPPIGIELWRSRQAPEYPPAGCVSLSHPGRKGAGFVPRIGRLDAAGTHATPGRSLHEVRRGGPRQSLDDLHAVNGKRGLDARTMNAGIAPPIRNRRAMRTLGFKPHFGNPRQAFEHENRGTPDEIRARRRTMSLNGYNRAHAIPGDRENETLRDRK